MSSNTPALYHGTFGICLWHVIWHVRLYLVDAETDVEEPSAHLAVSLLHQSHHHGAH